MQAVSAAPGLEEAASFILSEVPGVGSGDPPGLVFEGMTPREPAGRCAAIDGGSTLVLDARSVGLYCVRAGYSLREVGDRFTDQILTRSARTVTRKTFASVWDSLVRAYAWGLDVPAPTMDGTRLVPQLAEGERILAEHDAARHALQTLSSGDFLLLDGSLDDEERYAPLREALLERARDLGVDVLAVSKDSCLSLGGVLPLTLELEERAVRANVPAPWWCDVTDALDSANRGYRILGVRLDERSPVYRVDVATPDPRRPVSLLLSLCNDAAYPGYPYILARIHQRVHYEGGEALDLRRDLESIVARRRGHRMSLRLFSKGRDVLELAN